MKETENRYTGGDYRASNPSWHVHDSPWKAEQILRMLRTHGLAPKTIAELGCGVGEITKLIAETMPASQCTGWEISGPAFEECCDKSRSNLTYRLGDLLADGNEDHYDLLLMIDVFEHVEDYIGFLRKAKKKADRVVFHIPLDMSVQTVLRMGVIMRARQKLGHLHYFSKDTALATLEDSGYEILDWSYTQSGIELKRTLRTRLLNTPRRLLNRVSRDLSARLLGGCSLIVLAQ